ncbi:MAG TPA: DUF3084 domain-containing protein [Candidatus Acidoferrales bacterium]|nr:DUF3084 domain-containing protein [Candidatus Acidoferrales bacterium]
MGYVGGVALIIGLTVLAGIIAYLGDRVGHQVGRRRLTLFGLRPKYTSTIVAVATGMFIAFAVMAIALAASKYARAAFFHLDEINDRVNQLQAEADALDKRVHETNVVVNRGSLMFPSFLLLRPTQTPVERLDDLSAFFDAVVQSVNRDYVPRGLRPFKGKASDPENQRKLASLLSDESTQSFLLQGPVLVVAVADENLFLNDPISFSFTQYADKKIFSMGQRIASVEVQGGTQINPTAALSLLVGAVSDAAVSQGMPVWYAEPTPILSESQVARIVQEIRDGHGRYQIVGSAAQDIYPHVGGLPIRISLTQPRRS